MKKNNKSITLPTNVGQSVKFPGTHNVCLSREFKVSADGTITVSNWLASQANRHCPDVHNLTGEAFIKRAVAWFTGERVQHSKRRTPRGNTGLVNVGEAMAEQLAHCGIRV